MRQRLSILATLAVAAVFVVLVLSSRVQADFHDVEINQLMAGALGGDDIEFVELRMLGDGENCQGSGMTGAGPFGCEGPPTLTDGAMLVFFDGSGAQTGEFVFPGNTPVGAEGRSILVATLEFAEAFSVQPDFIMSPNVVADSGRVCYRNVIGASRDVDECLAYGNFTGNNGIFGGPAAALPITGSSSLFRIADTSNNATDFKLGPAVPRNNGNEIGGPAFQPGDANGDGNVNALDITTVELIVVGALVEVASADANGDGEINALDITATEILVATDPPALDTTPPTLSLPPSVTLEAAGPDGAARTGSGGASLVALGRDPNVRQRVRTWETEVLVLGSRDRSLLTKALLTQTRT